MQVISYLLTLAPRHYNGGFNKSGTNFLRPSIVVANERGFQSPIIYLALLENHASQENIRVWGPGVFCDIVQMYHALKLLSCCTAVYEDTLCACYHVANNTLNNTARRYLPSLADSGIADVLKTRHNILSHDETSVQTIAKLTEKAAIHHASFITSPLVVA